jgi:cytidylate kinase
MAIITISRGSHSRGRQVAEGVAERLGYDCVAREVLLEASGRFDVPEARLIHAAKDAPSFLDRVSGGRRRYVSFIQAALLRRLRRDDVVYHGYAGQFFVADVSHVLKVRVVATMDDRVGIVVERDGVSPAQARRTIERDDAERRNWALRLYGIDPTDPCLYDLVVQVHKLGVDDAVDLVCAVARLPQFETSEESQKDIDDLALAGEVQAALMELTVDVEVFASSGVVTVRTVDQVARVAAARKAVERCAAAVAGVERVELVSGLLAADGQPPASAGPRSRPSAPRLLA